MNKNKVNSVDIPEIKKRYLHAIYDSGLTPTDLWNEVLLPAIEEMIVQRDKEIREEVITEDTSDGYHTFKELYEYRKLYNALLFNEWYAQRKYSIIKSKRHSDGEECFGGGWFIVMAETPAGQVSNHYELADWGLFNCPERPTGYEYDGHTPQDVAERLKALTNNTN